MDSHQQSQQSAATTFISFQAELARHKQNFIASNAATRDVQKDVDTVTVSLGTAGDFIVRRGKAPLKVDLAPLPTTSKKTSSPETPLHEEKDWEQCKQTLSKKAQLYEQLCDEKSRRPYHSSSDSDEDEIEGNGVHLVDFTRKAATKPPPGKSDKLVEYVDAFGRSRFCRPEELSRVQKEQEVLANDIQQARQRDLMSSDMQREEEREAWDREARAEMGLREGSEEEESDDERRPRPKKRSEPVQLPGPGPVYFEHLRKGEVRQYGIGYYRLSTDESVREQQLEQLRQLHEVTEENRQKNEVIRQKRREQMQERLNKIKKRRGIPLDPQPAAQAESSSNDQLMEELQNIREAVDGDKMVTKELDPSELRTAVPAARIHDLPDSAWHHTVREWDKGKTMAPVKQKQTAHGAYIKSRREERNPEFAPPKFL